MSRVAEVRAATPEEWDAAWERCDYATYFHSREWAEVWRGYAPSRYAPAARLVSFEDGARAILAASVRRGRFRLGSVAELSPASTFGGWVSTDVLRTEHATELTRVVMGLGNRVRWRINPYDPLADFIAAPVLVDDTTQVVELSSDFESVFHAWDQGQRQKVGQARRAGIEVRLAEGTDDWRAYYVAYVDSLRRWGSRTTATYPWRLFETIAGLESPRVRLWLATIDSKVIAGTLCFYARRHVVYWHGAVEEAHIKKRPVNLLLHAAMSHACQAGMRWFDFNPSGGHESVRAFKDGFGVVVRRAPVVGRDVGLASVLSNWRRGGR